jgi:hypothetical protein
MNRIIQTEEHNMILNRSIGFGSIKFVVSERRFLLIAAIFFFNFHRKKIIRGIAISNRVIVPQSLSTSQFL